MAKYDYIELANKNKLTEAEIKALLKFIHNSDNKKLVGGVIDEWYDNIGNQGVIDLTSAQQSKGLTWIKNHVFKKNGEIRKDITLSSWEADIVKKSNNMYLSGLQDVSGFFSGRSQYAPIYNVEYKDGTYNISFDYIMRGGKIELV